MSDADRLLDRIEEGIVTHGGDLGGWTRRDGETLQLFDGRVTLRAKVQDDESSRDETVHAHVVTTLHEHDDEQLDACLMGLGQDREGALAEAAMIWITCVAGPIRSFLDGRPICMTCQAGVEGGDQAAGYSAGDYGLPGLRAYVGPSLARGFSDDDVVAALDDSKPWFRYAAESAAPRRVHLAKSTIVSEGRQGWRRELEIDGHEVAHQDPQWPAGVEGPEFGYLTRFAVFEFPRNSTAITRRAELDRTICHFAERLPGCESVEGLMADMVQQGFDPDFVHEAESISTIAFGRSLFEHHGVQYASTVFRARRDGRVETDVPLMSIPAYSRARALVAPLRESMTEEAFQSLCFYNAESQAIFKCMESQGEDVDLSQVTMFPCVVPDRGVSDRTMDTALAMLHAMLDRKQQAAAASNTKKPWWKFW